MQYMKEFLEGEMRIPLDQWSERHKKGRHQQEWRHVIYYVTGTLSAEPSLNL